jgi:hypothetical protein
MVDFKNPDTVSYPVGNIAKILILEKKDSVSLAYEQYISRLLSNRADASSKNYLLSRIYVLYIEVKAMLKRHKLDQSIELKVFDKIMNQATITNQEIKDAVIFLFDFLDEIRLTRIDTKKDYDTTDLVLEDEITGF